MSRYHAGYEITQVEIEPSAETDLHWVRRYGGPISHAALHPGRSRFRVDGIDGLLVYTRVDRSVVVMGDPICAAEDQCRLADVCANQARG